MNKNSRVANINIDKKDLFQHYSQVTVPRYDPTDSKKKSSNPTHSL